MKIINTYIMCMLLLVWIGCTKYYTRAFIDTVESRGISVYTIKTDVAAFVAEKEVSYSTPSQFYFYLIIAPSDSSKAIERQREIDSYFNIDSSMIEYSGLDSNLILYFHESAYKEDYIFQGKVFRFLPAPAIPNNVDRIVWIIPYFSIVGNVDTVSREPIRIELKRLEYSKWGPAGE